MKQTYASPMVIISLLKPSFLSLIWAVAMLCSFPLMVKGQTIQDDFEGDGDISTWFGDDCEMNTSYNNPFPQGINTSATVLRYYDYGGQYANIRFDAPASFDLSAASTFSLKIYVPSDGVTGSQPNQISLKLQNNTLAEPWTTQTEIVKPITLDQWQTVTFNFVSDNYINLDAGSPPPIQRSDLNRVLLQVNGENNNDEVIAYLDDFLFDATGFPDPNFNRLVWSDEFATDGPVHSDKWFHQTQLPAGGSWYNGEVQHYTDRIENTEVIDGVLHLTARKETFTDQGVTKQHTSARLNSKFAFTYGRVEVRAKMPFGVGTWPAIWMLGKNINEDGAYWDLEGFGTTPWPACGEMDIMEHWGHNQNYVSSATHTPSSHGNTENVGGQIIPTVSTEFHIYELEWTPERLVFSVDDVVHFVYDPAIKNADTWPFTADEYLLLNVAIQPSIEPSFTSSAMEIDYVRVFQEGDPVSTVELAKGTQLTYFPNPVQDDLTIVLPEAPSQDIKFELYQVDGKLIRSFTQTAASDTLTISGWNELDSGLYLLNFTAGGEEYSVKVVKK
ncbi:MAG: family 16 glycosylhydrolase [Bacteroidota bacterium]